MKENKQSCFSSGRFQEAFRSTLCQLADFQLLIPPYLKIFGCHHLFLHQKKLVLAKGVKKMGSVNSPDFKAQYVGKRKIAS